VAASWTQPKVSCPSKQDELVVWWVGLDGFSNSKVEQDGTFAYCHQGAATYYSWWEMYPTNDIQLVGSTVAPGDLITSSVSFASGTFTLAVTDATGPANSFSQKAKCGTPGTCTRTSAEWIVETPATTRGLAPWPNFGTWTVSGAQVTGGGVAGVITSFPRDQITIINNNSQNLAGTGALNATGDGFKDTWQYAW
jgi:Peptidase A4 family